MDTPPQRHYIRPMADKRYFVTDGGTKFREFGKLEKVETNDWGVLIYNDQGHRVGMIKRYYHWVSVALKAKRAIGSEVVIETGHSASTNDYFRDIYKNFPVILDFPEDAGQSAKTALTWARCRFEQAQYELHYEREQRIELKETIEQLTRSQKEAQDAAVKQLDEVWPEWEQDPDKVFCIVAAAAGGKDKPDKLDKAFALRLGIDTMKVKRLNVKVLERTYRNNVLVELPDYDNRKCQMALIKGNTQRFLGEWCIQTVSNNLSGFQKLEDELYGDWRTTRRPIAYYLQAHDTLLDALVNRAA